MSTVLTLATEASPVPSAPVSLLERLQDLRVGELWATENPEAAISLLGTSVRWSSHTITNNGEAIDFVLEDPDGTWHALRLPLRHKSLSAMSWFDNRGRLYLLSEALEPDNVTTAPTLGALTMRLGSDPEPLPARLVASGDLWATGTLLLGALDLVPETERPGHETMLALRSPQLVPALHQLRNWCDNHRMIDYYDQLGETWAEALAVLWPTIPGALPEAALEPSFDGFETLVLVPRKDWARAALAYLYDKSQDPESRLFWELRRKWAHFASAETLPSDAGFAAVLSSITVVPDFLTPN